MKKMLLLLALVVAVSASSHINTHREHARPAPQTLEFNYSPTQFSLYAPATETHAPILFTFPSDVTVASVFEGYNEMLSHLSLPGCSLFVNGEQIAPETGIALALKSTTHTCAIKVTCGGDGEQAMTYRLHKFKQPELPKHMRRGDGEELKPLRETLLARRMADTDRVYPNLAVEIMGDTISGDWNGYVANFVSTHWGPLHDFPSWEGTGRTGRINMNTGDDLSADDATREAQLSAPSSDEPVRIAMTADWGAGTYESDLVAKLMVDTSFDPHYTVHVGDVYYVGTIEEVRSNCLGVPPQGAQKGVKWPHGTRGSFALMGNHEMYSRAYGYFDYFLPTLGVRDNSTGKLGGQHASFFTLENRYWRIINLDTGYHTYSKLLSNKNNTQPDAVIDWLKNTVKLQDPTDTRGIIFFSHHQYLSAWDAGYLSTPEQLAKLVPGGRKVLWLWGHEHRLAIYDLNNNGGLPLNCYGRCVGNSGFPTDVHQTPKNARDSKLVGYDDRLYVTENGILPIPTGFNGFVWLTFNKDLLEVEYRTLGLDSTTGKLSETMSTLMVREKWVASPDGDVVLAAMDFVGNMTRVSNL